MFNENSQLVQSWVRLVKSGTYARSQVPKLSNLQEIVWSILDRE